MSVNSVSVCAQNLIYYSVEHYGVKGSPLASEAVFRDYPNLADRKVDWHAFVTCGYNTNVPVRLKGLPLPA